MAAQSNVQSWSSFVREPTSVLPQIEQGGSVVLKRRDGESLVITTESRSESFNLGVELAALVAGSVLHSVSGLPRDAAGTAILRRLPWLRLLSQEASDAFLKEFFEVMEACASVGNMTKLAELVSDWKATAAICANPGLAKQLSKPIPKVTGKRIQPPRVKRAKAG